MMIGGGKFLYHDTGFRIDMNTGREPVAMPGRGGIGRAVGDPKNTMGALRFLQTHFDLLSAIFAFLQQNEQYRSRRFDFRIGRDGELIVAGPAKTRTALLQGDLCIMRIGYRPPAACRFAKVDARSASAGRFERLLGRMLVIRMVYEHQH